VDETDERLLALIAKNDAAAVKVMVGRKLARLLSLATRMLGDRTEAEDVAQEAFLRIWRVAPNWRSGEAKFDTWLHGVALNLCRDRLRKRRETLVAEPPDLLDDRPGAEAGLLVAEDQRQVQHALAELPERQREAIVLQYYQELSNRDAAEVMGVSVEALESLLSRARRQLRSILGRDKDEMR
jgi:RNA polymerase sigma-70 factor (ECF subfamily)